MFVKNLALFRIPSKKNNAKIFVFFAKFRGNLSRKKNYFFKTKQKCENFAKYFINLFIPGKFRTFYCKIVRYFLLNFTSFSLYFAKLIFTKNGKFCNKVCKIQKKRFTKFTFFCESLRPLEALYFLVV